jgi:biotin transport system permease protein
MSIIGLYSPGQSVLHRLSAGWKMLGLMVAMTAVIALHQWWQLASAAAAVAIAYAVARIPGRAVWRQLRPLRWLLLVVAVLQVIFSGWQAALSVCGGLVIAMGLATLLTLTTRVTEILNLCQRMLRPFARLGVDPDRAGLVLAMTIRCIPLLVGIVDEVSDARKARGLGFSPVALVVPVVVRALRSADAMSEALIARGADD